MAKTKKLKLTENQMRLLRELPDSGWKFPGSLEAQSYRKLESMGYAKSAYKRTNDGKKAASESQ